MQQTIFYAVRDISNEPMMPKNLIHYCYYSCFYRSHCHFVVMRGLVASSLCVNCFDDFVNRLDGITTVYENWFWLEWTINPSIPVIVRLHRSAYISNRPSRVLYVERWGHGMESTSSNPIVVGCQFHQCLRWRIRWSTYRRFVVCSCLSWVENLPWPFPLHV